MNTTSQLDLIYQPHAQQTTKITSFKLLSRLGSYCERQETNRLFWLAAGLLGHGTIFTIATLATVMLTGNIFALFVLACIPMVAVVVVNLATMPTKVTIPVLLISLLMDIGVIMAALIFR